MSGSSLALYGDNSDLKKLFVEFNLLGDYKYIEACSELNVSNVEFYDATRLLDFGTLVEYPKRSNHFLVTEQDYDLDIKLIKMEDGSGVKKAVNIYSSPDFIGIEIGGEASSNLIVQTTISTPGYTDAAKKIFKQFKKTAIKNTKMTKNYSYILPGAYEKLKERWRLAHLAYSNKDYDIKLSDIK